MNRYSLALIVGICLCILFGLISDKLAMGADDREIHYAEEVTMVSILDPITTGNSSDVGEKHLAGLNVSAIPTTPPSVSLVRDLLSSMSTHLTTEASVSTSSSISTANVTDNTAAKTEKAKKVSKKHTTHKTSSKKHKKKKKQYVVKDVPNGKQHAFFSYEGGGCITTNPRLAQGKLHQKYKLDSKTGIWTVNGRYCIALGAYYSRTIGTKLDLVMNNGKVLKCILADAKKIADTNGTQQYHSSDGSVAEFVVDTSSLKTSVRRAGTISAYGGKFSSGIDYIRVYKHK